MKKLLLAFTFSLIAFTCSAQGWSWLKNIGFMNSVEQPMEAGYHNDMFGIFSKHDSLYIPELDCYVATGSYGKRYLVRYSSNGNLLWQKPFDVYRLAVSASNEVAVAGYFSDYVVLGDTTVQAEGNRSFFAWINESGDVIGVDVQNEGNTCILVRSDRTGNVYFAGEIRDTIKVNGHHLINTAGEPKKYIIKVNAQRQVLSSMLFEANISQVTIDLNNEVTIAGMFNDSLFVNDSLLLVAQPNLNTFVLRLSSSGDIVWCKHVYGAYLREMDCDAYNNIYVMGKFYNILTVDNVSRYDTTCGPNQCGEIFVVKLDEDGALEWITQSGRSMLHDQAYDFEVASSGNVYFTGEMIGFHLTGTDSMICPYDSWNPYLGCLSPDGSLNWYEVPYNDFSAPKTVASGTDGKLYWTGFCEIMALGSDTISQACSNNYTSMFYLAHMVDASAVNIPTAAASDADVLVYPNPSGDVFNIRYSNLTGNCVLNIYNQVGQKVHSSVLNKEGEGTYTISSDLAAGIYILQLETQGRAPVTRRIVKCR